MSSYLRLVKMGYELGMSLLVRQASLSKRTVLAVVVRWSPASVAKTAYLLVLAVVVSLLITPERSRAQFRGIPPHGFFPGFPFSPVLPTFGGGFTGVINPTFFTPQIPAFPFFPLMPGPMPGLPLSNFGTDSTGMFNPFLLGFGGFGSVGFGGTFFNPFGFGSFNTSFGSGMTGFGGFGGFGGFNGLGFGGGMGGFAGKGFGGFNGKKAL